MTIPLPPAALDADPMDALLDRFHEEHGRAYGYSAPTEPVEFVTLRVTAVGAIAKPPLRSRLAWGEDARAARKRSRSVHFPECRAFVECPIYDRDRLPAGAEIDGPAMIEEFDSTTVIHPGFRGRVDRYGNLFLDAGGNASPPPDG